MTEILASYHNQEICFYQLIGSRYPGFVIPKLYGFEQSDATTGLHGRILLEDLNERTKMTTTTHGLSIAQVNNTLDVPINDRGFQCCAVVEEMAKFHAFSRYTVNSDLIMSSLAQPNSLTLSDDQIQLSTRLSVLHEE